MVDERRRALRYTALTATSVSERLERNIREGRGMTGLELADDVAWIARQLVRLAELLEE